MSEVAGVGIGRSAIVVGQVPRGHDPKRADCGQPAAFGLAEGIFAVAVVGQLAFRAARQVNVIEESIASVDSVAVASIITIAGISTPPRIVVGAHRKQSVRTEEPALIANGYCRLLTAMRAPGQMVENESCVC
jgi:hypothetical protein